MALERPLSEPPSLSELCCDKSLALFLDFDGTLVDIAPTPGAIAVPAGLALSLQHLSKLLSGRLAIISGRSIADIQGHLGPLDLARAGSHGIERLHADGTSAGPPAQPVPSEVSEALRDFALTRKGLGFERKTHGAALHFRERPELGEEAIAHATSVAENAGMSVKHGSYVVEVVGVGADKSSAVRAFMASPPFRGAMPVFIGDDLTDEDGFRAVDEFGGFGIIVGDRKETCARYRLNEPASVRDWLGLQPG